VQLLTHSGRFPPDWTPGRAIIEFRNRWHVPNLSLRKYSDPGYLDSNRETLLHQAAAHGQAKLTATLLDAGASTDFYGDKGFRVLMNGVVGGNTNVLAALIGHGANPNATYDFGTPQPLIHMICNFSFAKPEVVDFLLRAGADPNIENAGGYTALDEAKTRNHTNYISVLIAHGGVVGRQKPASSP
jgi:ankyrin repeat protein